MKLVPLILISLISCSTAHPRPQPAPTGFPDGQPTVLLAGPTERGSSYVADHAGAVQVARAVQAMRPDGTIKIVPSCVATGSIFWARTSEISDPVTWEESLDGAIPAGARYVHFRMDAGVCLVATRHQNPVGAGTWWIDRETAEITPMSVGGDTPHCSGECPWYVTIDLAADPR